MRTLMKILTWNVNGIRARQAQFCELLDKEKPDVVCLQEIKAELSQVPLQCQVDDYHVFWHGMKAYSGVSLHLRKSAFSSPSFSHPEFDFESRIVQATIEDLVLASVYVPNGGKDYAAKLDFFGKLGLWAQRVHEEGKKLILCGDLNITRSDLDLHPKERKPGVIGQRPEERELFDRLLGEHLVDVTRKLYPERDDFFTWWAPWRNMRQRNIGWRIDYILASPSIAQTAQSCEVLREFGTSDHGPLVMVTA
jgi:exodeoxyribonuclease III